MKIVLIDASGYVGSTILAEALQRGHDVTALVRNVEKNNNSARCQTGRRGRTRHR